jgi:hypothetical protein
LAAILNSFSLIISMAVVAVGLQFETVLTVTLTVTGADIDEQQ